MKVDLVRLLEALGVQDVRAEGKRVLISCPLGTHSDSDPSFDIVNDPDDDAHGFWRCYGCHQGGGLVSLVRRLKNWEGPGGGVRARAFLKTIEQHAIAAGPERDQITVRHKVLPFGASRFNPRDAWITAPLVRWPGSLRSYAVGRGITYQQVDRWKLGYSVAGRLAGRIVFPIYDEEGRLQSYTARTAMGDRIRYMTPPRGEHPDRGAIFGRAHWPERFERRVCIVVEGAINALAVERVTRHPVAALGGSNDDPAQWLQLASFERLVLLADPDKAGDRVAEAYALSGGPEVIRLDLPKGTDAQSAPPALVRKKIEHVA